MKSHSDLTQVTCENLKSVRTLVSGIFPVSYSDKFYKECLENDLCRVIVEKGDAIAIVAVKVENIATGEVLYVKSLGVHPLYRERGIASSLIEFVEEKCREFGLSIIMLHVQISNSTAVKFYQNRGFQIDSLIKGYYQRCQPQDAYVMLKQLQ